MIANISHKKKKGIINMIEAVIAIIIMFIFMSYMTKPISREDTSFYQDYGREVLTTLDSEGKVRDDAISGNYSNIDSAAASLLPTNVDSDVKLCYSNMTCIGPTIANRTATYATSLIIAGNSTTFEPMEIMLYLWRRE